MSVLQQLDIFTSHPNCSISATFFTSPFGLASSQPTLTASHVASRHYPLHVEFQYTQNIRCICTTHATVFPDFGKKIVPCLTHLVLQRQLSYLSSRKLDHRQVQAFHTFVVKLRFVLRWEWFRYHEYDYVPPSGHNCLWQRKYPLIRQVGGGCAVGCNGFRQHKSRVRDVGPY